MNTNLDIYVFIEYHGLISRNSREITQILKLNFVISDYLGIN
jgi:hypothetical protein